jgi:hypothetical protein
MLPVAWLSIELSECEPNAKNIQNTVYRCAFAEQRCKASLTLICHSNILCLHYKKLPRPNKHSFLHTVPKIATKLRSSALGGLSGPPMVQSTSPIDPEGIETLGNMFHPWQRGHLTTWFSKIHWVNKNTTWSLNGWWNLPNSVTCINSMQRAHLQSCEPSLLKT